MAHLGIDPGLNGGFAFISTAIHLSRCFKMPVVKNQALRIEGSRIKKVAARAVDQRVIESTLRPIAAAIDCAAIELVQMRSSDQGLRTAAENVARIKTALERLGIKYYIIDAQDWQRHHGLNNRSREVKIKDASIEKAKSLGCRVPTKTRNGKVLHDGIADAWLIACYLRDICEREQI